MTELPILYTSNGMIVTDGGEVIDPDDTVAIGKLLGPTAEAYVRATHARDVAMMDLRAYDEEHDDAERAAILERLQAADDARAGIEATMAALFPDRSPESSISLDVGTVRITWGKARTTSPPLSRFLTPAAAGELTEVVHDAILACAVADAPVEGVASYIAGAVQRWMLDAPKTVGAIPAPKFTIR